MNQTFTRLLLAIACFFATASSTAQVVYVTPSGAGMQNGTSWSNAMSGSMLRGLLNTPASATSEVWIAAGTYKPHPSSRDSSFKLAVNVKAYGGFAGTETARSQRNWVNNRTILSGNIGVLSDSLDNSYHVITITNTNGHNAILDGFTIRDGNAVSPAVHENGGGIVIFAEGNPFTPQCLPQISNCIITNNYAGSAGGGVANLGLASLAGPVFRDCSFTDNRCGDFGGALSSGSMNGGSGATDLRMYRCSFVNNWAKNGGGGVYHHCGTYFNKANFVGCLFRENTGAFYNAAYPNVSGGTASSYEVLLDSCRFVRNKGQGGIAIQAAHYLMASGDLRVSNTVFDSNYTSSSRNYGSSLINIGGAKSPLIRSSFTSCTFRNNSPGSQHALVHLSGSDDDRDSLFITNSLCYNNGQSAFDLSSSDNAKHVAIFTNTTVYVDSAGTAGGAPTTIRNSTNLSGASGPGPSTEGFVIIRNCILWHCLPGGYSVAGHIANSVLSTAIPSGSAHSAVYNSIMNHINAGSPAWPPSYGVNGGNNSGRSPRFVDTARNDFRLLCNEPGINAGNNAFLPAGLIRDASGAPRINGGRVDIGALETDPAFLKPPTAALQITISGLVLTYTRIFTGGVDSVKWDFGDGNSSTSASGTHTYLQKGNYTICLRLRNGCGAKDTCFRIGVGNPSAVPSGGGNSLADARVYPVPTRRILTIENANGALAVLLNSIGQQARRFSVSADKQEIDIAALPCGQYMLRLTDASGAQKAVRIVKLDDQ